MIMDDTGIAVSFGYGILSTEVSKLKRPNIKIYRKRKPLDNSIYFMKFS
jgi:hypothetical protein